MSPVSTFLRRLRRRARVCDRRHIGGMMPITST